jgi:hypothetical protein
MCVCHCNDFSACQCPIPAVDFTTQVVSGFNCKSVRAVAAFAIIIVGILLAVVSAYSIIAAAA